MKQKNPFLSALLLVSSLLGGCQQEMQMEKPETVKRYETATVLQGRISGEKGFIAIGELNVTDNKGQLIASTVLNEEKTYHVDIPAQTALPLILTFSPKTAGAEELMTVAIYPSLTKYDLNPSTTLVAKKAKQLGGYSAENMVRAAESGVHVPDADKTSSGFHGDPTAHYGGWH